MAKGKEEKPVPIVYVGKKPFVTDNVAGSKKTWAGFGAVAEVTPRQADILLRYPDQWAIADSKPPRAPTPEQIAAKQAETAQRRSAIGVGAKRLEDMNEDELRAHAKHYYDIDLAANLGLDEMLDAINETVRNAGYDAEKERNADTLTAGASEE